jgi:hypothetical protein
MVEKPGESGKKPALKGTRDESTRKGSGFKSPQQWNGRHAFKKPITHQPKFEGKCTKLKGFIYDCPDLRQQADIFTKTTKEIAKYAATAWAYLQVWAAYETGH